MLRARTENGLVTLLFDDAYITPGENDLPYEGEPVDIMRFPLDASGCHLLRAENGAVRPASEQELEQERRQRMPEQPMPGLEERLAAVESAVLEMILGGS